MQFAEILRFLGGLQECRSVVESTF